MKMRAISRRGPIQKKWSVLGLIAAASWCWAIPLAAEEAAPGVEADAQSRFTASSNLAASGGRVSQWSNSIDLSAPVAGSSAYGLGLDLIAERLEFHFSDFSGFLPGRSPPLSGASVITLQPTVALTPSRSWSLIESALVQHAGADGARSGDATLWGGSVAAAYQYAANLKIGLGFEVLQRMNASALFVPFPIIDWRISDRWSLLSVDGETGRLSFAFTRTLSGFGQLEFQSQDIRLGRSASIPSGIMRYEAYPLSLGIQWKPRPRLTASLSAGEAVAQKYRFEDGGGRLLRSSATHAPLIGALEIDCSF